MIKKDYKYGSDAKEAIKNVAKQIGDTLGKTLGTAGRNYFLPQGITNDGKTIVSEIRFEDECEDQVALAFHEIARQQDKDAGDGTTTSLVVGAKLISDVIEQVGDIEIGVGKSPMELMKQLDEEKDKAIALLDTKVKKVESLEDLKQIAKTSMEVEGYEQIAEAMWKVGKDGYPILKEGINGKIEIDTIDGLELPFNIATEGMFNGVGVAEYNDCIVLVANHCFEQYLEITPFMASFIESKPRVGALVVVAKQFSVPFVNNISTVSKKTNLPIILVSANVHQDTFEDIASFVDAKAIDTHPKKGEKITDAKFIQAGFAKSIIARSKSTVFIGGRGIETINSQTGESKVLERVSQITKLKESEKDSKEVLQMERRIGALLGGIVTVYVDAKTLAERYYLKLKIEDTVNSCHGALNDGMLVGGGQTLSVVAEELGQDSLLYNSLREPYARMKMNNMNKEMDLTGVYDAYTVIKGVIENAVSVAKVVITIEGIIADHPKSMVEELTKLHLT